MHLPLLLLLCYSAGILLTQSPSDGASLLGSEVEREVFFAGIKLAERVSLVGVNDGQAAGDGFTEIVAAEEVLAC